jgi:hypothetical protein
MVDVDEVQTHGFMADADLARAWLGQLCLDD